MCHPAVLIAFSALQAGTQYIGQKQQADAMYSYQLDKQEQTVAIAADAARDKYEGTLARMEQTRAEAAIESDNLMREYKPRVGTITVAAGAGGVSGGIMDDIAVNLSMKAGESAWGLSQNADWAMTQLGTYLESTEATQRGQVEQGRGQPVAQPNAFAAVSQVVNSVFSAYAAFPNDPMFSGWSGVS